MADDPDQQFTDDGLVEELVDFFLRTDPVPPAVLKAAEAAFELRDLDAQLAVLLQDSAVDEAQLAGVRGSAGRLLRFGTDERFVELDINGSEFAGYVVPALSGQLRVEHDGGAIEVPVDAVGRFRGRGLAGGRIRLRFALTGQRVLLTSWVTV